LKFRRRGKRSSGGEEKEVQEVQKRKGSSGGKCLKGCGREERNRSRGKRRKERGKKKKE
jgi:hypothetical protein